MQKCIISFIHRLRRPTLHDNLLWVYLFVFNDIQLWEGHLWLMFVCLWCSIIRASGNIWLEMRWTQRSLLRRMDDQVWNVLNVEVPVIYKRKSGGIIYTMYCWKWAMFSRYKVFISGARRNFFKGEGPLTVKLKGRGRLRLEIGPPLKSPRGRPANINSNSLISKNNKSDLPGGSLP